MKRHESKQSQQVKILLCKRTYRSSHRSPSSLSSILLHSFIHDRKEVEHDETNQGRVSVCRRRLVYTPVSPLHVSGPPVSGYKYPKTFNDLVSHQGFLSSLSPSKVDVERGGEKETGEYGTNRPLNLRLICKVVNNVPEYFSLCLRLQQPV